MGLRRIEEKIAREAKMREKGAEIAIQDLEKMVKSIKNLHKELEKLEKKFGGDLQKNPEAARRLMEIRDELGLPRHIGVFELKAKPSLTERLRGAGPFFEQLAFQVLEMGKEAQTSTGGILSLSEVIIQLNKKYEGVLFAISDISRAVDLLKKNGLIHNVRSLEGGLKIVEFFDVDLSGDHETMMRMAARRNGELSLDELLINTKWSLERANRVIDSLVEKKITQKVSSLEGVKIYFPGL